MAHGFPPCMPHYLSPQGLTLVVLNFLAPEGATSSSSSAADPFVVHFVVAGFTGMHESSDRICQNSHEKKLTPVRLCIRNEPVCDRPLAFPEPSGTPTSWAETESILCLESVLGSQLIVTSSQKNREGRSVSLGPACP